jgi:SH3-like domain-containing protein
VTVVGVGSPRHGRATLNADGTVTYTPEKGFYGTDSFRYTVRDANGALAWIESRQLTDKRTVMVKVPSAPIRQKPEDNAPVSFQAQQNVVLELLEVSGAWVYVRHREAGTGYVKAQQVWGV